MSRRTVRLRLTVLYGGLFLISGAVLLAITYALVAHTSPQHFIATTRPLNPPIPISGEGIVTATHGQQTSQVHWAGLGALLAESAIALAIMSVVSIALGWVVAGRVLRPLRAITVTTRQISEHNLHERLAMAGPGDEIKDLADTVDDLIARLEAAFDAQRQFVANASHELRTPLTVERALLEMILTDPDATTASFRSTCEELLVGSERQERLIEALLTLARSQRGLEHHERIDLAAISEQVILGRHDELEHRQLTAGATLCAAPASGNPRLAERLIANLIDNAIRHNVAGGDIRIETGVDAGRAVVSVANTGPIIQPEEVDGLFHPFRRAGAGRTDRGDGLGLGLSIVHAIATAHRATVTARAQPGGGLRIDVTFSPPGAHSASPRTPDTRTTATRHPIGRTDSPATSRTRGR
jgi:signal transduction histidine kinase